MASYRANEGPGNYFQDAEPSVVITYPTYSPRLKTPPLKLEKFKVVLCIYTGGTIGMTMTPKGYSPKAGYLTKFVKKLPMFHDTSADHLIPNSARKFYKNMSPPLITPVTEYGERVIVRILEYDPLLDSSNVSFMEWKKIAADIAEYYDFFDGFVILHGTDTMAFTASALSFMLESLGKTVCITGSQIPLCRPRNDGIMNLLGAVSIAGQFDIPEVVLYFGSKLLRGCRSSKLDANGLSAFDSPNLPPLATVGVNININWALVRPHSKEALRVKDHFCNDITLLRIYPGPFNTLEHTLKNVKGLVLQTFGSGNAPQLPAFLSILKKACDNGVVILNCTQCIRGDVQAHYAAGTALRECGVISCGDMTPEAALIKLGWLLGAGLSPTEVKQKIRENLRGEKKELHNINFNMKDESFARAVYNVLKKQDSTMLHSNVSGANNLITKIDAGLLPPLINNFAAMGAVDELNEIFSSRNNGNHQTLSPNICDYDNRAGLHLAARHNQLDVVNFLLDLGADINIKDAFGRTPLREALENENMEMITLLSEHDAEVGMTDTAIAANLCTMIRYQQIQQLAGWLSCGVNVNVRDYDERTPLMIACANGNIEIVEMLLKHGADPTVTNRFDNDIFKYAQQSPRSEEIIRLLEKYISRRN